MTIPPATTWFSHTPRASAPLVGLLVCLLLSLRPGMAESLQTPGEVRQAAAPPVTLRIAWGGGLDRSWRGAIRLVPDEGAAEDCGEIVHVASLCEERNPQLGLRIHRRTVEFGQTPARDFDGFDVTVADWQHCRLVLEIEGSDGPFSTRLDEPVLQFLLRGRQQAIDRDGNRLSVARAPGDDLRVSFSGEGPDASAVRTAGERLEVSIQPSFAVRSESGTRRELHVALLRPGDGKAIHSQTHALLDDVPRDVAAPDGRVLRSYQAIDCEVPLPEEAGVYQLELSVLESGGLRWARPLANRRMEFVTVSRGAGSLPDPKPWETLYEFDAGSPRLFDRLRRLSSMPSVPLPAVPSLDLPSMGSLTTRLPGIGRLPGFSDRTADDEAVLPAGRNVGSRPIESFFPRFSGPLPGGHGIPAKHPLGMMLQLPPSPASTTPAWEAVVVPGAEPGLPHLIELEYPSDQDIAVGVLVLEPNELGVVEPVVWSGGFESQKAGFGEPATVSRYQQVFWPQTKTPMVVLVNLSPRHEAMLGRMRVLSGPERLPIPTTAAPKPAFKRLLGMLPKPEFSRFGVTAGVDDETGRPVDDWKMFSTAVERMADLLRHQAAAGAVVTVYGEGTPSWPSKVHSGGLRWDSGQLGQSGTHTEPKDVLELLCRVFGRDGLELMPAIECSGPLATLEALRLGGGSLAVGIECVGGDGEPPPGDEGVVRYNVLDPRVQDAIEQLVIDLARRVAERPTVRGIALMAPHDGWLHLPGVAWGLDDATIARFMSDTGLEMPMQGSGRFAERAALVEGDYKAAWLEWRCGQVAAFHCRLADAIAAQAGALDLQIVPTTIFVEGPLAKRFRPSLNASGSDQGLLREIGFEPQLITAHPQLVFVRPRTHRGGVELVAASTSLAANRSPRLAADVSLAERRAAVHVEQPFTIGLGGVLQAAPFSAGQSGDQAVALVHAAAVGSDAGEVIAGPLASDDVEAIIDSTLLVGGGQVRQAAAEGVAALPARDMRFVDSVARPLVIRRSHEPGAVVASVVNASPVACVAQIHVRDAGSSAVDAAGGELLPVEDGTVTVPMEPWGLRAVRLVQSASIDGAECVFEGHVEAAVEKRLRDLRARRGVLDYPVPLEVLDNPDFELPIVRRAVPGWELVEKSRGTLAAVEGRLGGEHGTATQAAQFASRYGLSTLRSNPFAAPTTGRLSVAVWLRIEEGNPQPPLRIAIEGLQGRQEYYRFAPVGQGDGAMPLSADWAQIVLQVDDLPTQGLESLRVRLDLLGPGKVCVDEVRVFDLAFDEAQRVQLSKMLALIDHQLNVGDLGGSVLELDGHWPRFLETHINEQAVAIAAEEGDRQRAAAAAEASRQPERTGMLDRLRSWWQ